MDPFLEWWNSNCQSSPDLAATLFDDVCRLAWDAGVAHRMRAAPDLEGYITFDVDFDCYGYDPVWGESLITLARRWWNKGCEAGQPTN